MEPITPLFQALDFIADSFNVVLTLLALALPALPRARPGWRDAGRYVLAALGGLGVVYGVQALDDRFHLWASLGLDYSTHTAYAVSLAVSIAAWNPGWARWLGGAVLGYALLIWGLAYHGPLDIATAALVAGPATWGLQRLAGCRRPSPLPPAT